MKYTVIIEREPDGGFVVSVPVLPGCVPQGDTKKEAIANITEAMNSTWMIVWPQATRSPRDSRLPAISGPRVAES